MTESPDIAKLDAAIAALESKLTAFRALREVLANSDAADEVRSFFTSNGAITSGGEPPRKSRIMQKIEDYFAGRHNEWATIEEITTGAKLKKGSVRQAIYKGHVDKFDRDAQVGGGRPGKFRIKK